MISERFDNSNAGIAQFYTWLKDQKISFDLNSLLVIENTGIYHRLLWQFCSDKNLPLHIGNAAHLKWSLGITRGKSDKIDCKRLCHYCFKHADELQCTPALNSELLRLKDLMSSRSRLVVQHQATKTYLKELSSGGDHKVLQVITAAHQAALNGLKESIKYIDQLILEILQSDVKLLNNYNLVKSVPGIGHYTALYIISCTNNFAGRISGKQLASYAGVVPFEHSSGSSIKGASRVHKMSNKELKKMLHLCALTTIKYYPEFREYFERKKAEGKNGMSVINAIKNKLLLRVAAVVNNQKLYVDNHNLAA